MHYATAKGILSAKNGIAFAYNLQNAVLYDKKSAFANNRIGIIIVALEYAFY